MIGAGVRSGVLLKMFGLCVLAGVLVAFVMMPAAAGTGVVVNRTTEAMANMSGSLARRDMPQVSVVTDRDGEPIAHFFKDYRVETKPDQISDTMKAAITAVEDKRFWNHGGVDWQGTVRAMASNASGGATQGASSITQQYVKNYLVHVVAKNEVEAERAKETTIARKLREAKVAVELERTMTKDEILTGYLNVVPFGNQTFGVGAASQTYFRTTPDKLTVPQAALLAAIVNQPGQLNPESNPQDAMMRRNRVIDLMSDPHNRIRITKEDAEQAKKEPLGIVSPLGRPPNGCVGLGDGTTDGFFCEYLRDYLEKSGIDDDKLETGGYTVRTTLDRKASDAAKEAAEKQVPTQTAGIANAMAAVEPGTDKHKVRALVANRDFGNDPSKGQTSYDIVSRVQPFGAGSIYKVFTAAAAIQQGMSIFDTIDVPASYTSKVYKNGTAPYTVGNAEGVHPGPRTLQMALATSPNTGFVKLLEQVGLNNAVDLAGKMGLREGMWGVNSSGSTLDEDGSNGPSQAESVKQHNRGAFTLGYTPTSVLELSNVSATILSGGKYCPPTPIEEVRDRNGNQVPIKEAPCEQAISPQVAAQLAQGMSLDDKVGTSRAAAQAAHWTRPMIGKTGTTQEHKSAGFLAGTPQMAGAVLTYADGSRPRAICDSGNDAPPFLCSEGNIYGGKVPARTWYDAMMKIHEGLPVVPLPGTPPGPPPGPPPQAAPPR